MADTNRTLIETCGLGIYAVLLTDNIYSKIVESPHFAAGRVSTPAAKFERAWENCWILATEAS
jgi:hypothetical protein